MKVKRGCRSAMSKYLLLKNYINVVVSKRKHIHDFNQYKK